MQDLKFILTEENKIEEDNKRRKDLKSDILRVSGGIPSIVPYNKEFIKSKDTKKWVWSEFHNPARNDNFHLKHWQRIEDIKKDYEYAQYNKKISIVNVKKEEFDLFSHELDPSWSWEETVYFLDLCRSFDLRFIVIQDRYNFVNDNGKDRSVEELKERYYSLSKRVLEYRKQFDHPILKSGYCYEQEIKRRACLERIINKSSNQQKIENELIQQSNEIKEKQEKLSKIEAIDKKQPKQIDEQDIAEGTFEDYIRNKQPINSSFSYLRSYKINHPVPINEKIQKKIEIMLKEMITEKPIPTERIENAIDILKNNLIIMVSLKKHLEKKQKELKKLECTLSEIENKANKNKSQNNIIVTNDPNNKLSLGLLPKKEKKKGLIMNSSLKLSMNKKRTNFEEESKTENSSSKKQKKKFDLSLVSIE